MSVIVPNYNHSEFLKDRLDSVFNQSYPNIEVLLLDDGSSDSSMEILNSYSQHPNCKKIISNLKNGGNTFKQWEKGLLEADGEWIWIAESDDFCELNFLETCMSHRKDVGLVFTASTPVDSQNDKTLFLGKSIWPNDMTLCGNACFSSIQNSKKLITTELYCFNHLVNASAVIFKKEFAPNVKEISNKFKLCGDWMFWVQILSKCEFHFIQEPLNSFRCHPNTVRQKMEQKMEVFFEICSICHFILKKFKCDLNRYKMYDFLCFIYFNRYSSGLRKGTFIPFLKALSPFGWRAVLLGLKTKMAYA